MSVIVLVRFVQNHALALLLLECEQVQRCNCSLTLTNRFPGDKRQEAHLEDNYQMKKVHNAKLFLKMAAAKKVRIWIETCTSNSTGNSHSFSTNKCPELSV